MATLSLSSAAISEQNGALKHSHHNGTDHDAVLSTLMKKLQMTSKQIKAWSQTSHKLRLAMAKYTEPDPVDPARLQRCLDKLKTAIKVSSLPATYERLEAIARQLGLKANSNMERTDIYLSSDCFYVEVKLATNGSVKDLFLVHGMTGNPQNCPAMCDALKNSDFKEFTEHLKGLCQMYQLPGDSKVKSTAFNCLQALEIDLKTIFQIGGIKVASTLPAGTPVSPLLHIAKAHIGYLTHREGGHPMRLTYFVSPYDLLDVEKKKTTELSTKEPLPKDLGLSVTVGMETSTQRKIQTAPTIIVTDNKVTNVMQLTNQNSIMIQASFVLTLSAPMPMSIIIMKQLQSIAGVSTQYADLSAATPLNTLICRFTLDPNNQNQAKETRHSRVNAFSVELPDQHHLYIINDSTSDTRDMQGALLSKISFTSPNNVPKIISMLRQQAVYNALIASCVRNKDNDDSKDAILFEVTPYTHQKMTVTFEHPARDRVACLELDLTDHSSVKGKLHGRPGEEPFCTDEYATKVLQKCLSIPVTMRAIMKKAEQWTETNQPKKPMSFSPAPSSGPSGGSPFDSLSGLPKSGGLGGGHGGSFIGSHRPHASSSSHHHSHSILSDLTTTMSAILPHGEGFDMHGDKPTKVAQNPMLASLLQQAALSSAAAAAGAAAAAAAAAAAGAAAATVGGGAVVIPPPSPSPISSPPSAGPKPNKNPMLINLLQEHNLLTPVAATAQPVSQLGRPGRRGKRVRSMSSDKSPKRQHSEDMDDMDELGVSRTHYLQQRLADAQKMTGYMMEPPRTAPHMGELSALLSEVNEPIMPVKPKRGRPCRLDSTSSQSSISARQSPMTPSTPSVPTTPTYALPKPMSHSTLSTPEHPSTDDMHAGMKVEQYHQRPGMESDLFSHNSKNIFTEELLQEVPRPTIDPETGRRSSFKSQYSLDSLDINEDLLQSAEGFDNDDEFGGLPMVSSAIARMGIPTGSDFDEHHRSTAGLPPMSLSALTGPGLSTAIQAGLETRTDVGKMGGALDLSVPHLVKSMSIPEMSTVPRGRPPSLAHTQRVSDLSRSMPPTRVPVSKGKPKNFTASGLALQNELSRKGSKKRARKGVKDSGGFSDSDAPRPRKRGRQRKARIETSSSESSPEPSPDFSSTSITMAVNKEQPLKMTFKTIRYKPDKEQKDRGKDASPAPKIKIRAVTSGDSATPSPNPVFREIKPEDKPDFKPEAKMDVKVEKLDKPEPAARPEKTEKAEPVSRPPKLEPHVVKTEIKKEAVVHKDETIGRPSKETSIHRADEHISKAMSHEPSSKGTSDVTVVKSENIIKSAGIVRPHASSLSKGRNDMMKKARSLDPAHRAGSHLKSPIAELFPKKSLASLPRIPKLSKQSGDGKQSPGIKGSPSPKSVSSPSSNAKTVFVSSPKKQVWGKGDSPKVGSAKRLISAQRMGTVSPTGRKPDGSKVGIGRPMSSGNKSPLVVGQAVRKQGPNILSKSLTSPTFSPNSSKGNLGMHQGGGRGVISPSHGMARQAVSPMKSSGSQSPVPRTSAGLVTKPQSAMGNVKLPTTPTSSPLIKIPSTHGISLVTTPKVSLSNVQVLTTSASPSVGGTSSFTGSTANTTVVSTAAIASATVAPSVTKAAPSSSKNSSDFSTSNTVTINTTAAANTVAHNTSSSSAFQPVSASPVSLTVSSKTPSGTITKTVTTPSNNRPPPLVIPQNAKIPPPSITSPPTPTSATATTPTSAGPNSGKQTTPKAGMRGVRKNSLMGIIDKIKDKVEKSDKTVEKAPEKTERAGLFSALGSGTPVVGDAPAIGDDKEKTDVGKGAKETTVEASAEEKVDNIKPSKPAITSKPEIHIQSKDNKVAELTTPVSKSDSSKPQHSKVSAVSGQMPVRQPSPSPTMKQSGASSTPSSQMPGVVKIKSSSKPSSQQRPPKVGTPPLTGSQKRASSPTGKVVSVKQNKPSPLSTSSTSTSASLSSPVRTTAKPVTPVARNRPIILSHTSSTYQSPEKGQQKVTKVQLVVQPELMQTSLLTGQPSSTVSKMHMTSSQPRVSSPVMKSQTPSAAKHSEFSKKSVNVIHKPTSDNNSKHDTKQAIAPKPVKPDQGSALKPKPSSGSQQNAIRLDTKPASDFGSSKSLSTPLRKPDQKPTDPRVKRDSFGPGKDKDSDNSKAPKPALVRSSSKESKGTSNSGSQDGKGSTKPDQKSSGESSLKPKTVPSLNKSTSHEAKMPDKEKQKSSDGGKVDSKEGKGKDDKEQSEETSRPVLSSSSKPPVDFKVPSPAMVPSPKAPLVSGASPKPVIKAPVSPKVVSYSPRAPSPHSISPAIQDPTSPKAAPKRSATPVNTSQQPPAKKVREIAPPYSPVDSDDDFGMVIDMPQSPRGTSIKPQPSPRPESRSSNTQTEAGNTSPRSAVAHSPLGQIAQSHSPLGIGKSPASVKSIGSTGSASLQSPCKIDDDLMDEVLTTSIHPEDQL